MQFIRNDAVNIVAADGLAPLDWVPYIYVTDAWRADLCYPSIQVQNVVKTGCVGKSSMYDEGFQLQLVIRCWNNQLTAAAINRQTNLWGVDINVLLCNWD